MILSKDSYVRHPPLELSPKQVVTFNAMTYALDVCAISHKRLLSSLSELSEKAPSDLDALDIPTVLLDANLIIGHALVFKRIIVNEFGIDPNEEMFKEINKGKDIRDSNQHFDERLYNTYGDETASVNGYLTWRKKYPETKRVSIFGARPGSITGDTQIKVSNRNFDSEELDNIIQRIEFTSIVRKGSRKANTFESESVLVNKIILELKSWVAHFEPQLEKQFRLGNFSERHIKDVVIALDGSIHNNSNS